MTKSIRRRTAACICAALLLSSVTWLGASATEPEDGQAGEAAGDWPVNPLSIVESSEDFRANAVELLGDRFVEYWLTQSQDHFVVGVLNLEDGEADYLEESLSAVAPAAVVNRLVSRDQLDATAEAVKAAVEECGGWATFGVNHESAAITVGLPPDSSEAQVVACLAPLPELDVLTGDPAQELSSHLYGVADVPQKPTVALLDDVTVTPQESSVSTPLRGGKSIGMDVGSLHKRCTAGLPVDGAGGKYYLTAGHCGPSGSPTWFSGYYTDGSNTYWNIQQQGPLQNNTIWGKSGTLTSDAAVFSAAGTWPTPSVWRHVVSNYRAFVASGTSTGSLYTWVCFQGGITAQEFCGTISGFDEAAYYDSTQVGDGLAHYLGGLIKCEWDSGAPGTQEGDSGGPVYSLNPDGTAIAWGILAGFTETASYFSHVYWATNNTGTSLAVAGRSPFGYVDSITGGAGKVTVRGWTIDPDMARTSLEVHVYLWTPATTGDRYRINANLVRDDVAAAYPSTGNKHGFEYTITTPRRGTFPVYIYAIDVGGANVGNPLLGSATVNVY
jgi:hypothetical protein